jgi:hypothetical protein
MAYRPITPIEEMEFLSTLQWSDILAKTKDGKDFDITVLGSIEHRLEMYQSAVNLGIITKDDIRKLEGII